MELYKVLLVDDESMILRGMEEGISWESFGFEVTGTASNGQEAWEMIQNDRPDVLISDIRMPFMNGLELVQMLNENYIKMKVILVSGYDDFEYAQKAIRYGVQEYLLKPISMPQMEELLKKMHQEIEAEIEEKNNKTYLQQMYQENLPILKERFLTELIEGQIPQDRLEKRLKNLHIDFDWDGCIVAALQLVGEEEDTEMKYFSISKVVHEIFEGFTPHLLFRAYEKIILIAHVEEEGKVQNVLKCLNEANVLGRRFLQCSFYCGVGNLIHGLEQVERSYKNAVSSLEYSVVSDDEPVIYIKDIENPLETEKEFSDEQYVKELTLAVKMSDERKIQEEIEHIFREMERCKMNFEEYQTRIMELCFSYTKIARQYGLEDQFLNARCLMTEIFSMHTGEQLKRWILQHTLKLKDAINQKRLDNNDLLAQKAKEYIDVNFRCADLSVETLCDYLHISPSHFSSIFKKIHGINFINYLTNKRIEEAVFLLRTTDYKTKVISEMVGYPESNYFSYVFKKCTNISPANFRKQERNRQEC